MPRRSLSPLPLLICLTIPLFASTRAAAQDWQAGPHVRTEDAGLTKAIREGLEQSPAFLELMTRIDRSPGLVYVVSSRCLTRVSQPSACMDHNIRTSGGFRFLRVNIRPGESGPRLLALIAHELQHALEVLADETVTTLEDVERLYQRIGSKRRSGSFETDAALRMQDTVYREASAWYRAQQSRSVSDRGW